MNPAGQIPVNLARLEADLKSAEAEVSLWRNRLNALVERGSQEYQHVQAFCKSQGYTVAAPYLRSIKEDYTAQADMIQLQIAKLDSQIAIMKALQAEAGKIVKAPGLF
jgi:hypothetical protein